MKNATKIDAEKSTPQRVCSVEKRLERLEGWKITVQIVFQPYKNGWKKLEEIRGKSSNLEKGWKRLEGRLEGLFLTVNRFV